MPNEYPVAFELGPQDIHLWLCHWGRDTDSETLRRQLLAGYCGVPSERLKFTAGENGKPRLVEPAQGCDFNISHSGEWLLCAVTAGVPVGADVQFTGGAHDYLKLARRFFSESEAAGIESLSDASARDRFYDLWALKEAAVKARGEALAPGLKRWQFSLEKGEAAGSAETVRSLPASEGPAHYLLFEPLPGYRASICWLQDSRPDVRLLIENDRAGWYESTPRWLALSE